MVHRCSQCLPPSAISLELPQAKANRGILYVDEVNLLDDGLVDVVLDSSASGLNTVEREGVSIVHPAKFIMIGSGNPQVGAWVHAGVLRGDGGLEGGRWGDGEGAERDGGLGGCNRAGSTGTDTVALTDTGVGMGVGMG